MRRTPSRQVKQAAHDDPPPPETHDETGRRDAGTRRARGQIEQAHATGERDEKDTRKTHRRQDDCNETHNEMRNETQGETSTWQIAMTEPGMNTPRSSPRPARRDQRDSISNLDMNKQPGNDARHAIIATAHISHDSEGGGLIEAIG